MLGAEEEVSTEEVIGVHEFVNDPDAGVGPPTWKNWMVVLIVVTYQHVFSAMDVESDVFRFAFNYTNSRMERRATTDGDKEQARNPRLWAKDGTSSLLNPT